MGGGGLVGEGQGQRVIPVVFEPVGAGDKGRVFFVAVFLEDFVDLGQFGLDFRQA